MIKYDNIVQMVSMSNHVGEELHYIYGTTFVIHKIYTVGQDEALR